MKYTQKVTGSEFLGRRSSAERLCSRGWYAYRGRHPRLRTAQLQRRSRVDHNFLNKRGESGLYEEILFPGVLRENWQMMESERIALTGVLSRMKPRGALEIGVYHGGSLSLAAQFCQRIIAIDIDPAVRERFAMPQNAELWIGSSQEFIPQALADFERRGIPLEYVLIDAEHSAAGVRRDINLVLQYRPQKPMLILIHDSANSGCRAGILGADWNSNPHVHVVQCDFVPGQIIEHSIKNGRGEVWGGLALAYLDPRPRTGELKVVQGAATMVRGAQFLAEDLSRMQLRKGFLSFR